MNQPLVEFKEVSKRFGEHFANRSVSFSVLPHTFHGLIGENGAGKSTAMKLLYGLHQPDSGSIYFNQRPVQFRSPRNAIQEGIGMVHQHFMLVPTLTVWENIILGEEPHPLLIKRTAALESLEALQTEFGFKLDLLALVDSLSLGEQQQVEILKALYRKADLLILDEPTAVLSPKEISSLFTKLRTLLASGKTVIVITHKLKEVLEYTDHVTIMRQGQIVQTAPTSSFTEAKLSQLIMGKDRVVPNRQPPKEFLEPVLNLETVSTSLTHRRNLKDVSLSVQRGEIVGLAGIEGNGQDELVSVLTGLTSFGGSIRFLGEPIGTSNLYELRQKGFGLIPPDRHQDGLVLDFSNADNLMLGHHRSIQYQTKGFLRHSEITRLAHQQMKDFDIRPLAPLMHSSQLSGGNQQKILLAREENDELSFLLACHPTRGVDIGAADFIHQTLMSLANSGTGILLISSDLDELFVLSDRLIVIREGSFVFQKQTSRCTAEELGLWMTGAQS